MSTVIEKRAPALAIHELPMDGTRVATALIAFPAGSRFERADESGIAHFLEHLVFKGGQDFPGQREISREADRLGAKLNAYTSRSLVAFHITCRSEVLAEAIDLLTDFVGRPRLAEADIETERGVILQEINRYQDQPASVASKLLDHAVFGDTPMGRPVLGDPELIKTYSAADFEAFRRRTWDRSAGGLFLAGNLNGIDRDRVAEMLSRLPEVSEAPRPEPAEELPRTVAVSAEETNQSHLRLHYPVPQEVLDEPRLETALNLYANLLGGTMSSRLWNSLREERGLCYSISAFSISSADAVAIRVSSGLESKSVSEAYELINETVRDLAENGPSDDEIELAREAHLGRKAISMESSISNARHAAGQVVIMGDDPDPEEVYRRISEVDPAAVKEVAKMVAREPTVAVVGLHSENDFS